MTKEKAQKPKPNSRVTQEKSPYYYQNKEIIDAKERNNEEERMQCALTQYMNETYPDADWTSMMVGVNLGERRGARFKRKGVKPGWMDMIFDNGHGGYHGLRLELKAPGRTVKEGDLQHTLIKKKTLNGYFATWTDSFEIAVDIIDWYYLLPLTKQPSSLPNYNPTKRFKHKKRRSDLDSLRSKYKLFDPEPTSRTTIANGDDIIELE